MIDPLRCGAAPDGTCALLTAGLSPEVLPVTELAAALARRDLDVALLPAHVYAAQAERYDLVPGLAIGSDGGCGFARLERAQPLEDVRRVAADLDGHAAEPLLRLLFASAGHEIELVRFDGPAAAALATCGARLVTGDRALREEPPPGTDAIDLGEAWTALTGLPFIWWIWAARDGRLDRAGYARLHGARTRGRLDPAWAAVRQPRARVVYRLGNRQLAGLRRFLEELSARGWIARRPDLRFVRLGGAGCRPRP